MTESDYSTHKSVTLAIREAVILYMFNNNREKDIAKVVEGFLPIDDYEGDRVPMSAVIQEATSICNMLQDNYVGLELNLLVKLESLPFYKSVSDCIRPFSSTNHDLPFLLVSRVIYRFFVLVSQSIELKVTVEKGLLRFDFASNPPNIMTKHQIDGAMLLLYRVIEVFCPGKLTKLYIAHRSAYELEYYESIFGVPVESNEKTSLVYNLEGEHYYKNATSLLKKSENDLGRKFYINPLYNMLSTQFMALSYKQRCEIMIDTMLGMIPPTRNHLANSMNISVSTLQRRLDEEGTSFQEILEETRKRLAKMYLTEKNLSSTDVAYLLGYKSHSQFFKVFKTWFGVTPKNYQSKFMSYVEDCSN